MLCRFCSFQISNWQLVSIYFMPPTAKFNKSIYVFHNCGTYSNTTHTYIISTPLQNSKQITSFNVWRGTHAYPHTHTCILKLLCVFVASKLKHWAVEQLGHYSIEQLDRRAALTVCCQLYQCMRTVVACQSYAIYELLHMHYFTYSLFVWQAIRPMLSHIRFTYVLTVHWPGKFKINTFPYCG